EEFFMRIVVLAAAVAAAFAAAPVFAQNYAVGSVAATAQEIYTSCLEVGRDSGAADPSDACACLAGYLAGALSDRDYEVAGVLLKVGQLMNAGASQSQIEAEIVAFLQRGFTEDDVRRVGGAVEAIAARGQSVCGQFEKNSSV